MLEIFKVLADEARLRILRSVNQAELSVAELVEALQLPQSTVSRHLKPLKQVALLNSRREGTSVYYFCGNLFNDEDFKSLLQNRLKELPDAQADSVAVDKVLDKRRRKRLAFFDQVAGKYDSLAEPGGGWDALGTVLASGFMNAEVADLGCGEGTLSLMLSRFAKRVTCVDQSQKMLDLVAEKANAMGCGDLLEFIQADVEKLSFDQEQFDAIFLSQSLHHVSAPREVVIRASHGLKPGGKLLILDLLKHDHEWTREQWADQWLGFEINEVQEWMSDAQLDVVCVDSLEGFVPDLSVLMAVGVKHNSSMENDGEYEKKD
ncbi:MAG: hypothetical protein CBE26_03150 [Kiritimatiellaceae bacterium TMED266]|jgi:ArsR family transcriptional regulator|nr:MAG: hypothetical protein CBE26_03150 [Kiritimatiellaceae bacterium TMED266]|tara:strand:- start:14 stop:970 length:957 start_codon:yes stop_codon:yes gene_type:complete